MTKYSKGDYANCRCNICEIVDEDDEVVCMVITEDFEKIIGILEENEKLKQTIAETEKMIQSTYDELTKLRCFRKNILRIKHSWDYLMEAIQYD